MRIESTRPLPSGGWLHARKDAQQLPIIRTHNKINHEDMHAKWHPLSVALSKNVSLDQLMKLAESLGVDWHALLSLGIGYQPPGEYNCAFWTFPERDERWRITGLSKRFVNTHDNNKGFYSGGRHGVVYDAGWNKRLGPIWIVEGATDVAAGITLGLCVIGRPSNTGGIQILSNVLRSCGDRRIIVLGERDKKKVVKEPPPHDPKCQCCLRCYPGLAGAKHVAKALAVRLGRTVDVLLPPNGFKDLRDVVRSLSEHERAEYSLSMQKGSFPVASSQVR